MLFGQMDRKCVHEKVAHALRSKKDPVAVKARRPRKKAGQPPPSEEEQDEFEQLELARQSIFEALIGHEVAAGAARDDDEDDEDSDDSDNGRYEFDESYPYG